MHESWFSKTDSYSVHRMTGKKWQMCLLHNSHSVNESNYSETDSKVDSNTNMVHNSHWNNCYRLAHLVAISLHKLEM